MRSPSCSESTFDSATATRWAMRTTPSTRPTSSRRGSACSVDLEPFILARVEIDFRAELRGGEEVEVHVVAEGSATKSFELEHEIRAGERLVAEAKSVLVGYDYRGERSVPLTENRGGDSPDERLRARRLSNGLRVLTAPLPHAQSVACFVMLAAGSRYERARTAASPTSPSTCSSRAPSGGRARAT